VQDFPPGKFFEILGKFACAIGADYHKPNVQQSSTKFCANNNFLLIVLICYDTN